MLFYRAALPLSHKTLIFASGIIRRHRKAIGSRWRKLNPGQQALLVLAYLRKGDTFAEVAAGFGVGTTTAWRYVEETVALLAAGRRSSAVRDAKKAGWAYVVLDGTFIPIDRVAADRPFYSGKHRRHGMNLQVIVSPHGDVLWVSGALPGSVHDKEAEWIWGVLAELEAAGLVTQADKGYQGSTWAKIPYRGKGKPESQKEPTAPTRNSADPASAQTPSSRRGRFCAGCAAAPSALGNSPRQSTLWRFTQHKEGGKGSLPSVVERLIAAANAQDTESFVGAFTPNAVIDDWGRQVAGHDEIRAWGECEFSGPDVRIDLTRVERIGQTIVLTVLTSRGTSNGSSHFAFDIDDGLVARMIIRA